MERNHLGRLPLQHDRSISLESKAPAEANVDVNKTPDNFNSPPLDIDFAVIVLTARDYTDRRIAIRETWGKGHENIYFIVGHHCPYKPAQRKPWVCEPKNPYIQIDAKYNEEQEALTHKLSQEPNVIVVDMIDVYRNLAEKLKLAYMWVYKHTNAKYILKMDDDSFARVDSVQHWLIHRKAKSKYEIIAGGFSGGRPSRSGKWAETKYKPNKYPPWPSGAGHIVSRPVIEYMYNHLDTWVSYQGEDTSLGIWMEKVRPQMNVERVKCSHFITHSGNCHDKRKFVIGHDISIKKLQQCYKTMDEYAHINNIKAKGSLKSCAFVANNPSMKTSASAIDRHDFVIRFNNYWAKKFWPRPESVWGEKTDAVLFNNQKNTHSELLPESVANCIGRVPDADISSPKFYTLEQLKANPRTSKCDFITKDSVDGTWKRALKLIRKYETDPKWKTGDISPTTGFLGVLWFEDICNKAETHFYGFDDKQVYWQNHRYNTEHKIIHDLFPMNKKPSCAVVFNSGNLLKYEDGPVIDSYDWQIRFNMLSTKGFENHVGSKTTHEVVHFWSPKGKTPGELFSDLDSDKITGITFPIEQKEINGYNRWKTKTKSNWIMPSQDYLSRCKRKVGMKSGWCSSGMLATLWAVEQCSSVTVFGANHDPCYPYHYNDQIPAKCEAQTVNGYFKSKHNFDDEHKLLQKMHRDGKLNLFRFENLKGIEPRVEETSNTNRTPRHIYIDLGANWCNTLDLYKDLDLNMDDEAWEIYAFEASPFLQRYVNDYTDYKNGIREEPIVNVPRSGSSYDLASYGPKYGCRGSISSVKNCIYSKIGPELKKLKPDPFFDNNLELINSRKSLATETPIKTRYVHIPAAAGNRDGSFQVWGDEKSQLIGGVTSVNIGKWRAYTVPVVDVVTWMRTYFSKDDFIVLKMDIEGAEFPILNEMLNNNDIQNINYLIMECHSKGGNCNTLGKRLQRVKGLVIMEEGKDYKLHSYKKFDK
ncbi:glycosyltransferase family 29 protein [bacterium]|nr:glycosyltransferase family 29 protein [bacterium]